MLKLNAWIGAGLLAFSLSSSLAQADDIGGMDLPDVDQITRRADGRYDVICRDGSAEIRTAAQIRAGEVCQRVNFFILSQGVYWSNQASDPGRLILPDYNERGVLQGFVHIPIRNGSSGKCYDNSFVGRYTCTGYSCRTSYSTVYEITSRDHIQRNGSYTFAFDPSTSVQSLNWCN